MMKKALIILTAVFSFILWSCNYNKKQIESKGKPNSNRYPDTVIKKLSLYQETPQFIRDYLDSIAGKKHWIANPGENWNASCMQIKDYPGCQFVEASLSYKRYVLTFRGGGIAPSTRFIVIHFRNEFISDYTIKNTYPYLDN